MNFFYSSITQQRLDRQIMRIAERSDILKFLDPVNKFEELQKFIDSKWSYNPQFNYDDNHVPILNEALDYIRKLKKRTISLRVQNNLTTLMREKCEEVENKFLLLKAYHEQDRVSIDRCNKKLFWELYNHDIQTINFDVLESRYALDRMTILSPLWLQDHKILNRKQVKLLVSHHLEQIWWKEYRISFGKFWTTNMQVRIWPKPVVYINKKSDYNLFDICVSILHEIYGHLLRYKKWIDSGVHILQWWTANYLATEEWIAVFQAARIEWLEITWKRLIESYKHIIAAENYNRIGLSKYYQELWRRNLESIFRSILRLKRGIADTSIAWPGSVFYKDKVYADGFMDILKYLEKSNIISPDPYIVDKQLYMGRLKLTDLSFDMRK